MGRWYSYVPKDLEGNLRFRRALLRHAEDDPDFAEQLRLACAEDLLFWINSFCWIFEAREGASSALQGHKLPFITWEFQDKFLNELAPCLGRKHRLVEKSRDMGVTWKCLAAILHRWQFRELESWLVVSRNESYVDQPGNPKSLFWKLDFLLEHQPPWLLPNYKRSRMHLENLDLDSVIDGESTTGDVARGDRRSGVLLDEFAAVLEGFKVLAAVRDATDCVLYVSTHQGTATAFYDERDRLLRTNPEAVMRLHWSEHPLKAVGAYKTGPDGEPLILDTKQPPAADYSFILDGKIRSPWYDGECLKRPPREIAQELDIDPIGSASQFFERSELEPLIVEYCRPPYRMGDIEYTVEPVAFVRWVDDPKGRFRLWTHLDDKGMPPQDRDYAAGADIATGSASASGSNSCLSVGDMRLGEKVLEFADPRLRPDLFAELAVAVCQCWFGGLQGGAYLVWEANGVGRIFGDRVVELGYRRFFYRRNELSLSRKQTDSPGWWSTADNKRAVLGEYRRALLATPTPDFVNRSQIALTECLSYIYTVNGSLEHALAVDAVDPSGAKQNHGDRVLADALCLKGMGPLNQRPDEPETVDPPVGSMAWRNQQDEREMEMASRW